MPAPPAVVELTDELLAEFQRIEDWLATLDPSDRLTEIQRELRGLTDEAEQVAREWLQTTYPDQYQAGAAAASQRLGESFSWTQTHTQALGVAAQDYFDDILQMNRYMNGDVRSLIAKYGRRATLDKILTGDTAVSAGRSLREQLRASGIGSVKYRNGSRFGIGAYSEMLMRTKTALAYSGGALNQYAALGVSWVEVTDGNLCGWTSHNDGDMANGKIVTVQEAYSYPIAHPNCVRDFLPRPDIPAGITDPAQAQQADRLVTPEQRADQAAFEARRADAQIQRRARARQTGRPLESQRTSTRSSVSRRRNVSVQRELDQGLREAALLEPELMALHEAVADEFL